MHDHASINRCYRLVWSEARQTWIAVAERSRGRGKSSGRAALVIAAALVAGPWADALAQAAPAASALPRGGQVQVGQAHIAQNGSTLSIDQASARAAIDWQSFDIGSAATVRFQQPSASAVALNRVVGSDPTQIFGRLQANGQVFIVNPNGVLFAPGAQVSAAGVLASTRDIGNDDFAAGRYRFTGSGAGTVQNAGSLTAAQGGYVALVGAQVSNRGSIAAPGGQVRLAAADEVQVQLDGQRLASFTVTRGTLDALVDNHGAIRAEGGRIHLTAAALDALSRAVVNNTGVVEAATVGSRGGAIVFEGDLVSHTGSADASAAHAGQSGGSVSLQGRSILQAGSVRADASGDGAGGQVRMVATQTLLQTDGAVTSASSAQGAGGQVRLDGGDTAWLSGRVQADGAQGGVVQATAGTLTLAAAQISADGSTRGGQVSVGGGVQGASLAQAGDPAGSFANASTTQVNSTSTLSADGAGGQIVVWSDATTHYAGSARTGAQGFIEISGKGTLGYAGSANPGAGGHLLLDPTDITIAATPGAFIVLADPTVAAGDQHGSGSLTELSNGNLVVANPQDSFGAASAGAVYLYHGGTGALISALYGSTANDQLGFGGVTALTGNGNFVVSSPKWNNASATRAGAVTWGSGTAGVNGAVSGTNSLIGSAIDDQAGLTGVTALTNGHYVVRSATWDNGAVANAGAATWGSGIAGVHGSIGSSNSLVGSTANDAVGSASVTALSNGHYVVGSTDWSNAGLAKAGAVTWGNGTGGTVGAVSASNSLVGSNANDRVGLGTSGVTALTNGNYVVTSYAWDNGSALNAGAVTWGNGNGGTVGAISASNSLVGSSTDDSLGVTGLAALSNGHYVVSSYYWKNGAVARAGAVTWGNGAGGTVGAVSASNSLVGTSVADHIGYDGVTLLSNGNYVVSSHFWSTGGQAAVGAVTWASGATGISGAVSASNSLVGTTAGDNVGSSGVTALTNGNYVVRSNQWDNGALDRAGAATWGNGTTGITGAVSASNSLVGSSSNDQVSSHGVTALSNGNYVVTSAWWDNGSVIDAGAVTWGNGVTGTTGTVGASNSLVGSRQSDGVGASSAGIPGVTALSNGNYVVRSSLWDDGAVANVGAATWGNGSTGISGTLSASNSLIGSTANDQVGKGGITEVGNGHYVVLSADWNHGAASKAGAVTWGNGSTGISGVVSSSNSMVGSQTNDQVGSGGVTVLTNGHYVINSPGWDGGAIFNVGAVTWGDGGTGVSGVVGRSNSLVGEDDRDGSSLSVTALSNSRYVVRAPLWNKGTMADVGLVLLVDGTHAAAAKLDAFTVATSGSGPYTPLTLAALALAGTTTTLQATNNITVNDAVSVAGALRLEAGNTLTLNAPVTSTASGLALALSSQVFVNNVGSNALSTPNGRWQVWSATPANDTLGGLAYDFKQYGATYGSSSVRGTGNGVFYSVVPSILTATLSGTSSKAYDGNRSASATGLVLAASATLGGDIATLAATALDYDDAQAGSGKAVTATGVTATVTSATGKTVYGYTLGNTSAIAAGAGRVDRAVVHLASGVADKVYDGSTAATLVAPVLGGLVGNETLTLVGQGSVAFANKDAGSNKDVVLSGLALADGGNGGLASNYQLAAQGASSAAITRKTVGISASVSDKVYDGGTAATLASATLSGLVGSETLSIAGSNAAFADKDVGAAKQVGISALTLADGGNGGLAANYQFSGTATAVAAITPRTVGITASVADKVYDGSTAAAVAGASFSNLVGGETLALGSSNATFTDKDVGAAKSVSIDGLSLADGAQGGLAGNYQLASTSTTATAAITPKTVHLAAGVADKVYDGTTVATLGVPALGGLVGNETLGLLGQGSVVFVGKDAGTNKEVVVSGLTLADGGNGGLAGNYQLAAQGSTSAAITPRALGLTATASDKVYDGTTAAVLASTTLSGLVGNETLGVAGATADFSDRHVGVGKQVTISALTLADGGNGGLAANYRFSTSATTSASITPRTVGVDASVADKVYDGSTAATVAGVSMTNLVGNETLALAIGSAGFADTGVGASKTVTLNGLALADGDNAGLASNYRLAANSTTAAASITPRTVRIVSGVADKVYDGTTAATLAAPVLGGLVADETLLWSGAASAVFADKDAGRDKAVTVQGLQLGDGSNGGLAANYRFDGAATASITPKTVGVVLSANDKVYDGSTAATLAASTITGTVGSEALALGGGTASFTDKNAGAGKSVVVSGLSLVDGAGGGRAANYQLAASTATSSASITPRAVTTALTGNVGKVVDGNTQATLSPDNFAVGNLVAGEVVRVTATAGQYDDARVGGGKTVSVQLQAGDYAAAGDGVLLGNYALPIGTLQARIGTVVDDAALRAAQVSMPTQPGAAQTFGSVGTLALPAALPADALAPGGATPPGIAAALPGTPGVLQVSRIVRLEGSGVRLPAGLDPLQD